MANTLPAVRYLTIPAAVRGAIPQQAQLLIRYGIGVETEQPEPAHSSRIGTTGRVFLLLGKRIAQQRGAVAEPGPERLRHEPHERTEQREQQQYRPALTGRELPAPPGTILSEAIYYFILSLFVLQTCKVTPHERHATVRIPRRSYEISAPPPRSSRQ